MFPNLKDLINPALKMIFFNFQPLEVVSPHRDSQLQEAKKYSYLFNLSTHICKS